MGYPAGGGQGRGQRVERCQAKWGGETQGRGEEGWGGPRLETKGHVGYTNS